MPLLPLPPIKELWLASTLLCLSVCLSECVRPRTDGEDGGGGQHAINFQEGDGFRPCFFLFGVRWESSQSALIYTYIHTYTYGVSPSFESHEGRIAPQLVTMSVSFTSRVMVNTKTTRNLIMPMEKNLCTSGP